MSGLNPQAGLASHQPAPPSAVDLLLADAARQSHPYAWWAARFGWLAHEVTRDDLDEHLRTVATTMLTTTTIAFHQWSDAESDRKLTRLGELVANAGGAS